MILLCYIRKLYKNVYIVAAENGHIECLKYLHKNGCNLNN
jgi:hypothetical protein